MRIAVIGAGAAGLGAALALARVHEVALYEAENRLGGHANTLDVPRANGRGTIPVDTGFIVYNEPNYPNFSQLLKYLGAPSKPSDMSFSVSADGGRMEWAGEDLSTIFAQKRNAFRPRFLMMLRDVMRFNADAPKALRAATLRGLTLGAYLDRLGVGVSFREWYLLPMGGAIWSTPVEEMMSFPAETFVTFFENHLLMSGLGAMRDWRTVDGGSRAYVARAAERLGGAVRAGTPVASIERDDDGASVIDMNGARDRFDAVVLAVHSDQALRLLSRPSDEERELLGAMRYSPNTAILHSDPTLMPRRRRVWSSWNYLADGGRKQMAVTYWMNRLQGIDPATPLFVSLNSPRDPAPGTEYARFAYEHPCYDSAAVAAQTRISGIQGRERVWFCGAWRGYGFHEDALASGLECARALGAAAPWEADPRVRLLQAAE